MKQGAQLTLLTDGVVEARSATGELFGFTRAQAWSRKNAEQMVEAARAFGQEDDITVVTLGLADGTRVVASSGEAAGEKPEIRVKRSVRRNNRLGGKAGSRLGGSQGGQWVRVRFITSRSSG